jgi:hypothetical protein
LRASKNWAMWSPCEKGRPTWNRSILLHWSTF